MMLKKHRWYVILAASLVLSSGAVYLVQVLVFNKIEDTEFYMLQDLAFVPVQVLLVMLIIDRLLRKKEKESILKKLNMLIGVFFNEVGTELIRRFVGMDASRQSLLSWMKNIEAWKKEDFSGMKEFARSHAGAPATDPASLEDLAAFLRDRREDMLRLLENPNLLEHDDFTDLLWAVFHVLDELHHRSGFGSLPESDLNHLKNDIARAYGLLLVEWIAYMGHLKTDYPYLFSIAARLSPFRETADAVIR